jgi:hypothetical protein
MYDQPEAMERAVERFMQRTRGAERTNSLLDLKYRPIGPKGDSGIQSDDHLKPSRKERNTALPNSFK